MNTTSGNDYTEQYVEESHNGLASPEKRKALGESPKRIAAPTTDEFDALRKPRQIMINSTAFQELVDIWVGRLQGLVKGKRKMDCEV